MKQTLIDIDSKIKDAENCQKDGNFALAASIYENLIKQQPNSAFFYNKIAQVKAQSQNWQEAIDSYQKALELKIESPFWTYKNLGDALREVGQLDQAISSYQQAIAIEPNQPEAYDSLGQVKSLQDKYLDAIASYQKAIELGIKNPFWTYQNLGDALSKENRLDEAQSAFQQAQKLKSGNSVDSITIPDNPPPETSQANNWLEVHNRGDEHFINEEWEQSIKCYKQAAKSNAEYFWSPYNLARALAKSNKWDEAIDAYCRAIELKSDFQPAYSKLIEILIKEKHCKNNLEISKFISKRGFNINSSNLALETFQYKAEKIKDICYETVKSDNVTNDSYESMVNILVELSQISEAFEMYFLILSKKGFNVKLYEKLASLLYESNHSSEAEISYRIAKALDISIEIPTFT